MSEQAGGGPRPRRRSWAVRPPALLDLLLGAAVTGIGLVSLVAPPEGTRTPDAYAVVLVLLSGLPVVVRSRFPLGALVLSLPASLLASALGYPQADGGLGALLCLYAVTALCGERAAAAATAAATAGVAATFWWLAPQAVPVTALVANVLATLLFAGAGAWAGSRGAYVRGLEERNAALLQASQAQERAALAEARAAVAREIQDVLGHSLTALTVHAAAARQLLVRDPQRAVGSLEQVEELGRSALADVRRVVGLLDQDEAPTTRPLPRLTDLPELVQGLRRQGMAVTLDLAGADGPGGGGRAASTGGDWDDVADGPGLAVYRLVEESLGNAARHAGPASVRVRLSRQDGWLRVDVVDDGRGAPSWAEDGGGVGLAAVRQRVGSYGGSVTAGPRRGGGYEVVGRVPERGGRTW